MKNVTRNVLVVAAVCVSGSCAPQEDVAPIFQSAPWIQWETYRGVDAPAFGEFFEMLQENYSASYEAGWSIYGENPTVAYRATALPDGWESVESVGQERMAVFQQFNSEQIDLFNRAWSSRHTALYRAAPEQSVVPENFTVADIQALPYHRVSIYRLKRTEASAFGEALAARAALDRDAGIENFVLTTWWGGLGTARPTVMLRVAAESREADVGPNFEARRAAREPYMDEFRALTGVMNASAWHIERHDQFRSSELSFVPGS